MLLGPRSGDSKVIDQTSLIFKSFTDITATKNIIPALIRKVAAPRRLYNKPPAINPIILAKLPKLPATPCTAP